jgi:hypothetical protein
LLFIPGVSLPPLFPLGVKPGLGSVAFILVKLKKAYLPGPELVRYPDNQTPDGRWLLAFQFGNLGGPYLEELVWQESSESIIRTNIAGQSLLNFREKLTSWGVLDYHFSHKIFPQEDRSQEDPCLAG